MDVEIDQKVTAPSAPPFVDLDGIASAVYNQHIYLRISRLWYQRGGFDDGPIKSIHMVVTDEKGNRANAMVPNDVVDMFVDSLHERNLYKCGRICVRSSAVILRAVEGAYTLWFTGSTTAQRLESVPDDSIYWSYELTPINNLPPATDVPARLVDVIGIINSVSDIASFQPPPWTQAVPVRDVFIRDLSGYEIKVRLWGECAVRFNGSDVLLRGSSDAGVIIFYDMTIRDYNGRRGLASRSSTGWYINEDIPDINVLYLSSHGEGFRPITKGPLPLESGLRSYPDDHHPRTIMCKLNNFNLFENKGHVFRCAARMTRLSPLPMWWFVYCSRCFRGVLPGPGSVLDAPIYICSQGCPEVVPTTGYRMCLVCTDGTDEAGFLLIGRTARDVVGTTAMQVVRNNQPDDEPIKNLFHAAARARFPPKEFKALCSMRFRFVVRLGQDSFRSRRPMFQVVAVESCVLLKPRQSSLDLIVPRGG